MYNGRLALFLQCQRSEKRKIMDKKEKVIRMIMVIVGEILIAALAMVLFVHFALSSNVDEDYVRENIEIRTNTTAICSIKNTDIYDPNTNEKISTEYDWRLINEDDVYYNHNVDYIENISYVCELYQFSYNRNSNTYTETYYVLDENGENRKGEKFDYEKKLKYSVQEITKSVNKDIDKNNKFRISLFAVFGVIVLSIWITKIQWS